MSTTSSGLVSPDTTSSLPPAPEASTPPTRPPAQIPTFVTPSAPPPIPPVWEHVIAVLMKLPHTTAEGQKLRSWVTYHTLTSLEDFLMWELDTLQYDAITVCSLLGILPCLTHWFLSNLTPLGISSCSGSTFTIWFRIPISLCPQMPQIMP